MMTVRRKRRPTQKHLMNNMDSTRLKRLAGINEAAAGKLTVSLSFIILDPSNMQKAVTALLDAGFSLDLNYSMGKYIFAFKNEDVMEEAFKIASKVIDKAKEAKAEKL